MNAIITASHSARTHSFCKADKIRPSWPENIAKKSQKKNSPSVSKLYGGREVDARIQIVPSRLTGSSVAIRKFVKARIDIQNKKIEQRNKAIMAEFRQKNPNARILPGIKLDATGNPYRLTQIIGVNEKGKKSVKFGPRVKLVAKLAA